MERGTPMNDNLSTSGKVTADDLELSDVFTGHILLAEGLVNVIYKVRRKGQWFVLKALRPEFRDDLVRRELLAREFKLGRRMDHPNIVRFFSLENDKMVGDCIVMEYVDGVTLTDFLDTKPSLAARKRVAQQLVETMRYFHGLQIIHRDLKPSNILITRNGGNVKIIDFGLADSDDSAVLKQPVGSPKYMSPEQQAGDTLDGRPCPDAPNVTDIDGNTYTTVQIGCQCWMRENLRTTHYADGTPVPIDTAKYSDYDPYRYYPDHDKRNVAVYGYLYNWRAAIGKESPSDANPSGVQGICPDGWHLPSVPEFNDLESHVSSIERYVCDNEASHIGKALADTSSWDNFASDEHHLRHSPGHDRASNNATGFSALPAGDVIGGENNYFHQSAYFWTSTEYSTYKAPYRYVDHDMPVFGIYHGSLKRTGRSVRCVKNR